MLTHWGENTTSIGGRQGAGVTGGRRTVRQPCGQGALGGVEAADELGEERGDVADGTDGARVRHSGRAEHSDYAEGTARDPVRRQNE